MDTNIPPNEGHPSKRFNFLAWIVSVVVSAVGLWVASTCIHKPKSESLIELTPSASGGSQPPSSAVPQSFHPTEIVKESLKDANLFLTQIERMKKNKNFFWNDFKDFFDESEPRDTYIKLNRIYGTLKKSYQDSDLPSQKSRLMRVIKKRVFMCLDSLKKIKKNMEREPPTRATSPSGTTAALNKSNQDISPPPLDKDIELYLKVEEKLDNRFCHLILVRGVTVVIAVVVFLLVYGAISVYWAISESCSYSDFYPDWFWVAGLGLNVGVAIDLFRKKSSAYIPRDLSVQIAIFGSPEKWKERVHDVKKGDFFLALTIFSLIRDMIVNEDGLVNHRISWQIAVQVGLVAACVSLKEYLRYGIDVPFILRLVPIVGMVFSLFCFIGVKAAFEAVKVFRNTFQVYKEVLLPDLEAMPRTVGDRYVALRGKYVGYAYALLPGLMWLIASVYLIYLHDRYLIHEQKAVQYARDDATIQGQVKAIIQGQVLDQSSGTKLPGVIITCRVHQSYTYRNVVHVVSNADGKFLLRQPAAIYDVGIDGLVNGVMNGQVATVCVDRGMTQLMRLPTDTLTVHTRARYPTVITFRISRSVH